MVESRSPAEGPSPDDAEFRRGVRARDPEAWERLSKLFSRSLNRQASWLLPSHLDCDDVVGEVWFRALLQAHRYDPSRSPLPWLARICSNLCLNARRGARGRRAEPLEDEFLARTAPPAEDPDAWREACRRALEQLPERDREIVTLRYLFALSTKDIAELLGVADNTVDQALVRGIERLKKGPAAVGLAEWTEIGSLEGMERVTP